MKENTSLYVTLVATSILLMSILLLVMVGPVEAQETGNGSATIEYDYDNTEINYELNETLFESYRLHALSEPEESTYAVSESASVDTEIKWAENGSILYWSHSDMIYQFTVAEAYNFSTFETVSQSQVPAPSGGAIEDFVIGNDGQTIIYTMTFGGSTLAQVNLSTAYDIESMSSAREHSVDVGIGYETIDIVHNGQTMYAGEIDDEFLYWNNMTTAWDISTFEDTGFLWNNIPLDSSYNDIHFANDTDESMFLWESSTDNIKKLDVSNGFDSYSVEYTKTIGSLQSFTMSNTGMHLFINRENDESDLQIDTYDMNKYNATIVNGTGETIAMVGPLSQEGSIPYQTETNESGVQLHWNAVTNSTYSGSSNTITINATGSTDPPDTQPSDGMNIIVWAILFVVAIGTTTYSLFASMDNASFLLSSVSLGLWIVLSYGALGLRLQADGPDEFTVVSEPAVAILCIGAAGICVINSLVILFDWARGTEGVSDP